MYLYIYILNTTYIKIYKNSNNNSIWCNKNKSRQNGRRNSNNNGFNRRNTNNTFRQNHTSRQSNAPTSTTTNSTNAR